VADDNQASPGYDEKVNQNFIKEKLPSDVYI